MLQIIAQRKFNPAEKAVFVYTNPAILVSSIEVLFTKHAEILEHKLNNKREEFNLFYTVAHHSGVDGAQRPVRTRATFEWQSVLAWDIDKADVTKAFDYAECLASVLSTTRESLTIVNSGNGIHLLVNLKFPIRAAVYFEENKLFYKEICGQIEAKMKSAGLPGNLDPSIFEPARVLRFPGTLNQKPGLEDKFCSLVQYSCAQIECDLKMLSGFTKLEKENVSPAEVRRQYPRPDLPEMVKECRFIDWAIKNGGEVHEPDAFDLFSLLTCANGADSIETPEGRYTNLQLGERVFNSAINSPSLAGAHFTDKWEQAGRYGARKCDTINARWSQGCSSCPHFGKIQTPLALKSKEHVASEVNGYWMLNIKGTPTKPAYEDLFKVYSKENPFIVDQDERIIGYNGKHYRESAEISAKSWLEKKLVPSEPLVDSHCNEFLNKLRRGGHIEPIEEEKLFTDSVNGKLNCRNGIVDIGSGKVIPHNKSYGFKYCLPYDYEAGKSSEIFLDWLSEVMLDRVELMESLLDIMAYILWPNYNEHLFTFFIGEGANGKSTLIHLIQAMVGSDNFSSIGIKQLTENRFAPAALEGKLVNLSEESSGNEIGPEGLNIIKTLSAGGEMFVEKKNQHGYTFKNRAKLIFSANKVPRFKEDGNAIKRRLVVIPFDYTFETPDHNVEIELLKEVPAIASMLVARIQSNLVMNEGTFYVNRGGKVAEEAQQKFLDEGNSVCLWAQECLEYGVEVPEFEFIEARDAYNHYNKWCAEGGFAPMNKNNFLKSLKTRILKDLCTNDRRTVNKDKITIYRKVKFKEQNLL